MEITGGMNGESRTSCRSRSWPSVQWSLQVWYPLSSRRIAARFSARRYGRWKHQLLYSKVSPSLSGRRCGYYMGVEARRVPEQHFEEALVTLDSLLPGSGNLAEREHAFRQRFFVDSKRLSQVVEDIVPVLRERVSVLAASGRRIIRRTLRER